MWRLVRCYCAAIIMGTGAGGYATESLVPNGSFEQGGPGAAGLPAGWEIEKGPRECFRLTSDRPFDGRLCLELTIADKPGTLVATEAVSVKPGATYRLRYHFRIDSSNLPGGQAVYLQGRYRDAEGQLLDWRRYGTVTLNTGGRARASFDWLLREVDFTVPALARSLELRISPGRGWPFTTAISGRGIGGTISTSK